MIDKKTKIHMQQHSFYTDNKKRKNKSIMHHRLEGSTREIASLNFLLKRRSNTSLLEDLYMVLAMRNDFMFPRKNTEFEEDWGKIFNDNKEIVDRVLHTLFQWFGTNIGWAELQKFAEIMKEWPNVPAGKVKKKIEEMTLKSRAE